MLDLYTVSTPHICFDQPESIHFSREVAPFNVSQGTLLGLIPSSSVGRRGSLFNEPVISTAHLFLFTPLVFELIQQRNAVFEDLPIFAM